MSVLRLFDPVKMAAVHTCSEKTTWQSDTELYIYIYYIYINLYIYIYTQLSRILYIYIIYIISHWPHNPVKHLMGTCRGDIFPRSVYASIIICM